MQTFVMMVGELNYQNNLLDAYLKNELPFGFLTYFIFVQFVMLMPILLVNLMVSMVWQPTSRITKILVCIFKSLNIRCGSSLLFIGCVVDWFSSWRHCWSSKKCFPKKNSHAGMYGNNSYWWANNQTSIKHTSTIDDDVAFCSRGLEMHVKCYISPKLAGDYVL